MPVWYYQFEIDIEYLRAFIFTNFFNFWWAKPHIEKNITGNNRSNSWQLTSLEALIDRKSFNSD